MSKRCELQKEYYQVNGNYKGVGKYSDKYVAWLEDCVISSSKDTRIAELEKRLEEADRFLNQYSHILDTLINSTPTSSYRNELIGKNIQLLTFLTNKTE